MAPERDVPGTSAHGLRQTDNDRVAPRDLVHVAAGDARGAAAAHEQFGDGEQHGHDGQRGDDHVQRAERRFDRCFEQHTANDDRQRADGDHPTELRVVRGGEPAVAKVDEHRVDDPHHVAQNT